MTGSEQFLFQNVEGLLTHLPLFSQNSVPSGHANVTLVPPFEVGPPFEMPTGAVSRDVIAFATQIALSGMHLFCNVHHFYPLGQKVGSISMN
jgi:hypothetical protein